MPVVAQDSGAPKLRKFYTAPVADAGTENKPGRSGKVALYTIYLDDQVQNSPGG